MKNWSTYIFLLVAGALSLLATSCSQEDEGLESVIASQGKATVQFSIALGNSGAGSRATTDENDETWGDPYTPDESNSGNDFENTINPGQFHVSLTLSNGTPVTLRSVSPVAKQENDPINVYDFVAEVLVEYNDDNGAPSLKDAKIEVCANYGNNLTTFETSYTGNLEGRGMANIPMWGVHTITSELLLAGGNTIDLRATPIYLLRSMAKVEVAINPELNDKFEIRDVELNICNKKGYLKPKKYTETEVNTKDYNREECLNALNLSDRHINVDFEKHEDTETGAISYTIYVPEYYNPNESDDDDVNIFLDIYSKEEDEAKAISYKLEKNGAIEMTDLHLVRNHWYKYYIRSINKDIECDLFYQVIDWTEINNGKLIFGNGDGDVTNSNGDTTI